MQETQEGSIPGSRISAGVGNGKPFQYSCLGNPMDRGAWQATVHGVTKCRTQLHGLQPARLLCLWDFPGKNTGVLPFLLQGSFPTQGSNPCLLRLLHWQAGSSLLMAPGKPVMDLEMLFLFGRDATGLCSEKNGTKGSHR